MSQLLPTVWLAPYGCCISCSCVFWYSRHAEHCISPFSISAFISTDYTDFCTGKLVFSTPIWLLCSCLSICICSWDGIITHLPFMAKNLLWPAHAWWANIFVTLVQHLLFMWSPVLYMPLAPAGAHLLLLIFVYHVLMYILAGPLLSL